MLSLPLFLPILSAITDGNRFPMSDAGDCATHRSQIPAESPHAADSPQLCWEERDRREGSAVLFQQLGCGRVPRVFPRKEVRAGRPPVPGGPTSAQPPALRSFPYKAVVVAEEIDRKKKAIKSCVSVTCPALQEPGTSPPRAPR